MLVNNGKNSAKTDRFVTITIIFIYIYCVYSLVTYIVVVVMLIRKVVFANSTVQ